jgi:cytochrome P450
MIFFVAVIVVIIAAAIDMLYCNRQQGAMDFRWPFLRDIPNVLYNFTRMHDYITERIIHQKKRFGVTKLGNIDLVTILDPVDVKHMLKDNWANYAVGLGLRGEAMRDIFGGGIFNADGNHWYLQRKNSSREFSANIFRNVMTNAFASHTSKLKVILEKAAGSGKTVDMHALFFRLTLDAFGQVAFGLNVGGLDGNPIPFAASFDRSQEICAYRVVLPPFLWKSMRALSLGPEKELAGHLRIIDTFIYGLIDERVKSPTQHVKDAAFGEKETDDDGYGGLLAKLVSACDADAEISRENRRKYIRDMVVNFIIAGRDTTACALSWFVYELSMKPQVEQRLLAELDSVFQGRNPTYDDLSECHYLSACLSETLRLHPSVPFDVKTVVKDDVFPSGVRVRAGDAAGYNPYCMARLEWIWGADAAEFNPSRWLDSNGGFVRADAFKYPVFQAGPRQCLGVDMAMLEMKVVVGMLLPRLQFTIVTPPRYRMGLVLQMREPGLITKVSLR